MKLAEPIAIIGIRIFILPNAIVGKRLPYKAKEHKLKMENC